MDRTIGKSENRNNDGERLMISLLEIAKSINEVDDDKIIKYKDKDGESQEMTAGAAKKMDKEHPAKQAWDKMNSQEKGDDGSEKDDDDKLGGSDFDRDGGDEPDMDSDDDMDDDDMDDEKSSESENEDIIGELEDLVTSSKQKFRYFDVEAEDSEIDSGRYAVVRGNVKDDPDQHMSVTAVQDGADISYSINIGIGGTPIYFDSKEEAMEAAKKLLDDETIRDTMNGDGDPKSTVLADLDQHAKNVLLPDDHPDKPIPAAPSYFRTGKELDNETITINGQKYRAIKEEKKKSNPRVLKEIYDRTFRSLK